MKNGEWRMENEDRSTKSEAYWDDIPDNPAGLPDKKTA
jgi:hypothetical protein